MREVQAVVIHRAHLRSALLAAAATAALLASGCAKTFGGDNDGGGGGSSGSGTDNSCAGHEDATGASILVRFINNLSEEVYLWTPCNVVTRPTFTLYKGESEVKLDTTECVGTCGDAQTSAEPYCPSFDCDEQGPLLRIEAGAVYELDWVATEQVRSEMPESCYHASKPAEAECWREIDLRESSYIATGTYIPKTSVEETFNEFGCTCSVSLAQPGVCEINTQSCTVYTGDAPLPELTIALPSAGVIEFEIGG